MFAEGKLKSFLVLSRIVWGSSIFNMQLGLGSCLQLSVVCKKIIIPIRVVVVVAPVAYSEDYLKSF